MIFLYHVHKYSPHFWAHIWNSIGLMCPNRDVDLLVNETPIGQTLFFIAPNCLVGLPTPTEGLLGKESVCWFLNSMQLVPPPSSKSSQSQLLLSVVAFCHKLRALLIKRGALLILFYYILLHGPRWLFLRPSGRQSTVYEGEVAHVDTNDNANRWGLDIHTFVPVMSWLGIIWSVGHFIVCSGQSCTSILTQRNNIVNTIT